MDEARLQQLRVGLDALVERYQDPTALDQDPLCVPLAYTDPMDQEVAAWVAAHLAYGRVAPMLRAIRSALAPLGPHPSVWLRGRSRAQAERRLRTAYQGWVWRFHTAEDLLQWVLAWRDLDARTDGQGVQPHLEGPNLDRALSGLIQELRKQLPPTPGTRFTLPDPAQGAACKRWRMHMRWMIRRGWPDLGLWTTLDPAQLVIPVDTHVARFAQRLGLTKRKTIDARTAQEITDSLRKVHPDDPLRYDFALAHLGILGDCGIQGPAQSCDTCPLEDVCLCTQSGRMALR